MIDFKIKGTKLPVIPIGTEFTCLHSFNFGKINIKSEKNNLVSFGSFYYNNEIYILADREDYDFTNYYIFKESDIIKLAKEQGMIKEELIKGNWYEGKITCETFDERWLFKFDKLEDKKYWNTKACTSHDNYITYDEGYLELLVNTIKPANMEEVYKFFPEEKQEEFKLPEKWCVKDCKEVSDYARNRFNKNILYFSVLDRKLYLCVDESKSKYLFLEEIALNNTHSLTFNVKESNYTEITFEQFKKYVLKENNNMNKEIIGYKLIKPEYEQAAKILTKITSSIWEDNLKTYGWMFVRNSSNAQKLEEVGVLNLWFEPIYKSTEKVVSVGGKFDVVIKDNKIWHKSDDITGFVKVMSDATQACENILRQKYEIKISDIIFSKTGCKNVETKLSDWKQVYETYKNLQ